MITHEGGPDYTNSLSDGRIRLETDVSVNSAAEPERMPVVNEWRIGRYNEGAAADS